MAQLVLCGGMVPVTGRLGLDQLSWLMPARWGDAAASSTVDLRNLVPPTLLPQDQFWQHTRHFWLLDMGMLAGLAVFFTCCVPMEDPAAPLGADDTRAMHPPKHETFDLRADTNTDPGGMCGRSTSTSCSPGASTWPARRPGGHNFTT